MSVRQINMRELLEYEGREGLILQGCGGDLGEWVDGINEHFEKNGILLEGTKFTEEDCASFQKDDLTCLMFEFNDNVKLDMGKLAVWRISSHDTFGGTWLSDFVDHQFGGFHPTQQEKVKPDCALIGADGNIFMLMGLASKTLRQNGMQAESMEMTQRITAEAENYDQALKIIGEYVNITSTDDISEDEGMELQYD